MGLQFPIDAFLNSMVGDDAVLITASPSTVTNIRIYLHVSSEDAVVTNERFIGNEIYADGKDSDFQNAKKGDEIEMTSGEFEDEVFIIASPVEQRGNGWIRVLLKRDL